MNSQQVQQQQQLVSPSQQLPPPSQQIPVITSISGGPLLPTLSSPHHVLPHLVSESNQSLQAANAPWGVSVNVGMAAHHVDTNVSGMHFHAREPYATFRLYSVGHKINRTPYAPFHPYCFNSTTRKGQIENLGACH